MIFPVFELILSLKVFLTVKRRSRLNQTSPSISQKLSFFSTCLKRIRLSLECFSRITFFALSSAAAAPLTSTTPSTQYNCSHIFSFLMKALKLWRLGVGSRVASATKLQLLQSSKGETNRNYDPFFSVFCAFKNSLSSLNEHRYF